MTDQDAYFDYLMGRSRLGLLYRRYRLYPRICRELHGRVLDIGCGIGDFLAHRPNTVGVDVNERTVSWCRQQGLEAQTMPFDQIPFESDSFDGAVLDNVLEHIAQPEPLLSETLRVLRSGAVLVVGVPGIRGYQHDDDHKVFYDEEALIRTLSAAGFTKRHVFHMPFRSELLNRRLSQYCVYGVFVS